MGRFQADQTHCKRGHLFDEENTYIEPNGARVCKPCRRLLAKARRPARRSPIERLLARTSVDSNECWIFEGYRLNSGYATFWDGTAKRLVHRISYEAHVGPIPAGMTIDHTCHNGTGCPGGLTCMHKLCVNPDHLEAVPQGVNTARSHNAHSAKTHCVNGHAFSPENTRIRHDVGHPSGGRICRRCDADRAAMYRERKLVVA